MDTNDNTERKEPMEDGTTEEEQNANQSDGEQFENMQNDENEQNANSTESVQNDSDDENNNEDYDIENYENGETEQEVEQDPIAMMEKEIAAERDRYLRLAADFDNFRKRNAKERETLYNDAQSEVISKLLPVYDNLERALKTPCEDEAFYKGVEMTMTQFCEILSNIGLVPIEALGEQFDPNLHNAVMMIEDSKFGEKIIAEEYQKGFILGDKVIRHSTVVVAN
ncbi:MAG: nucleotide exchange factor GrpE [Oscillospiraceae bacterium]|nr:nucleotide exchange factor GrpE [Oscillospiraceae bacterium]